MCERRLARLRRRWWFGALCVSGGWHIAGDGVVWCFGWGSVWRFGLLCVSGGWHIADGSLLDGVMCEWWLAHSGCLGVWGCWWCAVGWLFSAVVVLWECWWVRYV